MSKKKFKDTTVGQLLFGAASVINPTLGNVLQGVTSPKEAIAEIIKSDAPADDKIKLQQISLKILRNGSLYLNIVIYQKPMFQIY